MVSTVGFNLQFNQKKMEVHMQEEGGGRSVDGNLFRRNNSCKEALAALTHLRTGFWLKAGQSGQTSPEGCWRMRN